jgi:hypothetical protein
MRVRRLVLAALLIATPARAETTGVKRLMEHSYSIGYVRGSGGALGDGVAYDAIRYSETNGWLMNWTFGLPVRIVVPEAPKHLDCSTQTCTYMDVTAYVPSRSRVSGAMMDAGLLFPWQGAAIQLGIAIGFYGQDDARHARDAIVLGAKVPITKRLYARMRTDFNIFGVYPDRVLKGYHKNSPSSAGLTYDFGSVVQATVDIERYDLLRGGFGGSIGLGLRL